MRRQCQSSFYRLLLAQNGRLGAKLSPHVRLLENLARFRADFAQPYGLFGAQDISINATLVTNNLRAISCERTTTVS